VIQQRVYQMTIQEVNDLRQRLISVWATVNQSIIDSAIDQRRAHLHACI